MATARLAAGFAINSSAVMKNAPSIDAPPKTATPLPLAAGETIVMQRAGIFLNALQT
jgi:hypothetical protein